MSKIINRRDGPPSPDSFSHANGGKGDQSAGAVPGWNRWAWLILDVLWLAGLALYVIAGYRSVPLHGDEPTLIYMSRDYYHLVQRRDVEPVLYRDEPANPAEQDLRLINGTVGKMAMGLAWDLAGLTVDDLNDQWVWEWSWNDNIALGHMPGERLLHAARVSSALFTVISAWVVFGIARVVAARRLAAWAASLIYVTTPAVLLNGRRAMMDGSMLGFIALTALVGVLIVRQQARGWRGAKLAALYALLGVCGGLAVASKHNAAITVAAVFAAVLVAPLLDARRADDMRSHFDAPHLLRVASASLLVIVTFLALNPAWWSDPLPMPERVIDLRRDLMAGLDHLIEKGIADPERLGIYGASYGGYMTVWTITQTNRFKAAVCQCGLTNLYSMFAQTDITPGFMELYFGGSPYDDPELYHARSAMSHVNNVTTPTLLLHGDQDVRVPIAQSYELHWALKHQGVDTQFVIYPREPHSNVELFHQADLLQRVVEWFGRYL